MDSYLPRQISQSDCKISSNCGKKLVLMEIGQKMTISLNSDIIQHLNLCWKSHINPTKVNSKNYFTVRRCKVVLTINDVQVDTQGNSFQNCTGGQSTYLRKGVLISKLSKQNETTLKRSDF